MKGLKKFLAVIFLSMLIFIVGKGLLSMFFYGPLYGVKSFQIFYGSMNQQKLKELMKSGAVILEPTALSKQDVSTLKEEGVKVFGYVSLMQLENWNTELKGHISESDYALLKGKIIYLDAVNWYIAGNGITSTQSMAEEVKAAIE